LAVTACLVPGSTLCPGAGATERPQEILYFNDKNVIYWEMIYTFMEIFDRNMVEEIF
jgi:hypothetical protein